MITAGQLPELTGTKLTEPDPSLYCDQCFGLYSANRGDYWHVSKSHVMSCCGEPMRLVRIRTIIEDVEV